MDDRSVVASTLLILTCLVPGLLAGGMLVIGVSPLAPDRGGFGAECDDHLPVLLCG